LLYRPHGVAADALGNLFIADSGNNRIRKVSRDGIINTIAGNGGSLPDELPAASAGVALGGAVEYHHATFDHYFVTANVAEIADLDAGASSSEWARTGESFNVFPAGTPDTTAVCRFFSVSFAPMSSHFYTPFANECMTVKADSNWQFEGEVFNVRLPAVDGSCTAGTSALYRLYNNGQGGAPNHRYTTNLSTRALMMSRGWLPEGIGGDGVIACVPE
jgi:hypothetical protein